MNARQNLQKRKFKKQKKSFRWRKLILKKNLVAKKTVRTNLKKKKYLRNHYKIWMVFLLLELNNFLETNKLKLKTFSSNEKK